MRTLIAFTHVSLDGYFVDANGDMSWAHKRDAEWNAFTQENARGGGGELVFGRITYDMMARFWPTPQAIQDMPVVADGMNRAPKVVFSRTLDRASWNNTRLVKGDPAAAIRKLKQEPGPGMVILGSGSIVSQLAPAGVIDEYQIVVNPVVLGKGRTMFEGIKGRLPLKRTSARTFGNGNVLLCYAPTPTDREK
jgi:dihydrofolate reductase